MTLVFVRPAEPREVFFEGYYAPPITVDEEDEEVESE
jgi:hypothetical protein